MDENQLSKYRAFFVSSFAFLYTFTRQTFLPIAENITLPNFNNINYFFSAANITSYFGLIYAIIQIPYGIAIDYFGINKMVRFLTGLMTIGVFVCAFSTSAPMFALGRLLTLFGCGGAFISTVKTLNNDLGAEKVKSITGLVIAGSVGFAILFIQMIKKFTPSLNNNFWRYLYGIKGILLLLIFIYFCILNYKDDSQNSVNKEPMDIANCFKIIKNSSQLMALVFFSLFFLMIFYSINETKFMADLLMEKLGLNSKNTFSILLLGFFGGFFTTPMVVNKLGEIRYSYYLMTILSILSGIMLIHPNLFVAVIFLFIVGYSNGMQMILIDMASKIIPQQYVGILAGVMNVLFVGGAFIPQQILYYVVPKIAMGSNIIFYGVIGLCGICALIMKKFSSCSK